MPNNFSLVRLLQWCDRKKLHHIIVSITEDEEQLLVDPPATP
jgi:hypothetical protein